MPKYSVEVTRTTTETVTFTIEAEDEDEVDAKATEHADKDTTLDWNLDDVVLEVISIDEEES